MTLDPDPELSPIIPDDSLFVGEIMTNTFHTEFSDLQPSGSLTVQDDLYINRDGANTERALIYFNAINSSLKYQNNLFTLNSGLTVSGSIRATGALYVNAARRSSIATIYFSGFNTPGFQRTTADGSLQYSVSSGALTANCNFLVNGRTDLDGQVLIGGSGNAFDGILSLNTSSATQITDPYLIYFGGGTPAYLKYQTHLFRFSDPLTVSGSFKSTSDVYINADETNAAVYSYLYFNDTRGQIRHANNTFGFNNAVVVSGSLATNRALDINANGVSPATYSYLYFNHRAASIKYYLGAFTISDTLISVGDIRGYGMLSTNDAGKETQVSQLWFGGQNQYIEYNGTVRPRRFQTSNHFEVQGSGSFARLICPNTTVKPTVADTGTIFYDTSANKLYVKNGTVWKSVTLT